MSRVLRQLTLLALIAALVLGCGNTIDRQARRSPGPERAGLQVAVSMPIFADVVANVTGGRADVFSIIPPNGDAHTYTATPRDIVRMTKSDTFIYVGANNEAFIEAVGWRRAAAEARVPELRLADKVPLISVDRVIDHGDHVHDLREGDPHLWLDPRRMLVVVDVVAAHLSEIDPDGRDEYLANASRYRAQLEALDMEIEAKLSAITKERRKIIVFHDAYTYFALRYDFTVVGHVLKSPGREPSAKDLSDLAQIVRSERINVVFKEPQFNTAVLDRFARDHGLVVGELLTDNFAGRVDSYADLMRFNAQSLTDHLAPK